MFTGLILSQGKIVDIQDNKEITEINLLTKFDVQNIKIGDSICCSGICLSVVKIEGQNLIFEVSNETLERTNLNSWHIGQMINMETSLKYSDIIGGHLVSGHIDQKGKIYKKIASGKSVEYHIEISYKNKNLIAEKGSIALDGVSLTVNHVYEKNNLCYFTVNIIPITQSKTNFGELAEGDFVNVEFETIARYVARWFDEQK